MMKKNEVSVSDIFVRKLSQRMGKLVTRKDLVELWALSGGPKSRVAYGIGKVKNQGIIESIGGGVYFIIGSTEQDFSSPTRTGLTQNDRNIRFNSGEGGESRIQDVNIENLYWQMIALLICIHSPSGAIVAHEKSMEYHLRDYSLPDRLVLYTRDIEKRIQVGRYEIHFRTLQSGKKSGSKNMYRLLRDMSVEEEIDSVKLHLLSLESSLLDVASLRIHDSGIADALILKFLLKYSSKLSRAKLGQLVQYRYIRAINRIRSLAKVHGYENLYRDCLDIIRKEGGGCYLNL